MTKQKKYHSVYVAAKAVIYNSQGELLTVRRSATDKRNPRSWDFPGGFTKQGESPEHACIREVQEETKLKLLNPTLKTILHYSFTHQLMLVFYTAQVTEDKVELSYEHDDYKWVSPQEFVMLDTPDEFKQLVTAL